MKNIKYYIISWCCLLFAAQATAQEAEVAFHAGAQKYIDGNVGEAKQIVTDALRYDPNNPKLNELLRKLEQKEKDQQQNQQEQQQGEQGEQEEQKKNEKGEQSEEEQEDSQQAQGQPEQTEPAEDNENPSQGEQEDMQQMGDPQDMQQMKISKEKARMILDAMRNQEIQYLQQQRKKSQNPTPDNKPDW